MKALVGVCLLLVLLSGPAAAQGYQCRTAPAGTSTRNCASEAFVTQSRGTLTPIAFAGLPACSGNEGMVAAVTDSTTNTWGATITGGGALHVLAYCDGSNWTVAGK